MSKHTNWLIIVIVFVIYTNSNYILSQIVTLNKKVYFTIKATRNFKISLNKDNNYLLITFTAEAKSHVSERHSRSGSDV